MKVYKNKLKGILSLLVVIALLLPARQVSAASIRLEKERKILYLNKDNITQTKSTYPLKFKNLTKKAKKKYRFEFKSDHEHIAQVNSSGVVQAIGVGETLIRVRVIKKSTGACVNTLFCHVIIRQNAKHVTMTGVPASQTVTVGDTIGLNAVMTGANGSIATDQLEYVLLHNTADAVLTQDGMVTALQEGTYTVLAKAYQSKSALKKYGEKAYTAVSTPVTIQVRAKEEVTPTPTPSVVPTPIPTPVVIPTPEVTQTSTPTPSQEQNQQPSELYIRIRPLLNELTDVYLRCDYSEEAVTKFEEDVRKILGEDCMQPYRQDSDRLIEEDANLYAKISMLLAQKKAVFTQYHEYAVQHPSYSTEWDQKIVETSHCILTDLADSIQSNPHREVDLIDCLRPIGGVQVREENGRYVIDGVDSILPEVKTAAVHAIQEMESQFYQYIEPEWSKEQLIQAVEDDQVMKHVIQEIAVYFYQNQQRTQQTLRDDKAALFIRYYGCIQETYEKCGLINKVPKEYFEWIKRCVHE